MSYTWSGTLFLGARIAPDTDIYFNPEVVSGVPFSGSRIGRAIFWFGGSGRFYQW